MLVMVVLSKCPASLRGDITKWLFEISVNVFVGKISVRVKDELWGRIVESISDGRAVMVYSARNEQHFDCHVHNTTWVPLDFDGLKMMVKPEKTGTVDTRSETKVNL